MKKFLLIVACGAAGALQSIEYEVQFENEYVTVAKVKILPKEEIGEHRDERPKIVIGLQGGVIRRLEANGTTTDVKFPTGVAVFRDVDPPNELHKSVNPGEETVELIMIDFKK